MTLSLSDTFQSQYFVQDKEGNVWGEIKPTDISIEHSLGELYKIELTGYLDFDIEKVKQINKPKIKTSEIKVDTLDTIPNMMSCEEWEKHKMELADKCKIKNYKGGNETEILEIYEKRKSDKLWSKLKEAKEKIIKADEITERVAEFKEKLEEDYNMYVGVDLNIGTLTKESEKEIAKAEHGHDVELHALKEGIKEIKAQLEICENYEQKMNILIAYGIIDKKTKQILA